MYTPRAARRVHRWWLLSIIAAPLVIALFFIGAPPFWPLALGPPLATAIAAVFVRREMSRLRSRLKEFDYLLCLRCGYPVRDVVGDRCPECGEVIERSKTENEWRIFAGD